MFNIIGAYEHACIFQNLAEQVFAPNNQWGKLRESLRSTGAITLFQSACSPLLLTTVLEFGS